jgi:hypothetical protein
MSSQAVRLLMLASLCTAATVAAAPGANAGSRFDGRWSAVLRTQSGPCQPAYRGAVEVANGVMVVAGITAGNGLSGRVSPNGSVRAHGLHGLELRRRIGAAVGQFRRRNLARAYGKR